MYITMMMITSEIHQKFRANERKYIMKEMITKKIKYILDDLDENLNQNKISFSSENPFVFHFAWQLFK